MTRRIKDLAVKALYNRPKLQYGGMSSSAAKQEATAGTSPGELLGSPRGYADGGAPQNPSKPWESWAPTNYKSWDDVPIINPQELVGKRIGSLEADLTRAGGQYTGIDQSQIDNPEPMLGGPGYPLMDESQKHKLGWAVQGKGKGTQKLNKDFDYIAVHAMKSDAHRSNTSIVNSVLGTMKAYMRDNRIEPEGLEKLKEIISKPSEDKELKELENFPGFDHPDLDQYIHSLGFKPRSALVDRLWSAAAEKTGSPQIAKILRDTLDKEWAGVPLGHAMYLLEVPKGSSDALVNLKKEGLPIHPSYDWGIHGRIVGRFAHPAAREILHEPWFKEKLEEHKEKIAQGKKVDINAAFRRALPVTTITQDIADRLPHAPRDIQSAKAAQLALNAFNDQWDTTETPVTKGGLGAASLAQAVRDSDSSSTLTPYDPKELQKMVRSGKFTGYKLKDGEVYFGLKRGTNYIDEYNFDHPDLTPNETALVSVVNNEPGAKGIGGAPVVLKAIQHGATALDAFAVPSKRHPNGFLPQFYSKFGFEELGRVPFDPQYVSPQQFESMKHEWTKAGWDESMGLPPLAIMKWRGNDKDRENAVRNYLTQSSQFDRPGPDTPDVASAARALQQGSEGDLGPSPRGRKRGDAGRDRGRVRDDSEARTPDRLARTLAALRGLSPAELEHFGIDPAQFERAKKLGLKNGGVADDEMPEIPNPVSVFPKPQRMFGPDEFIPGGRYLNAATKEDMTGHKASMASIGVGPNGKPYLTASSDAVDETGTPGRGSAITKANLFKKKAGWRWLEAPEGHENTDTIVSVYHRDNHHFALHAHYPKGVDLTTYPKEKNEPRLRPTTRGNITLGPQVGTISVRGKEHPVYNHVIVKADGGEVEGHIPHDDPRRAKNLAKFHGETPDAIKDGNWYHGTTKDFQKFRAGKTGAMYVSQDPEFASGFSAGSEGAAYWDDPEFVNKLSDYISGANGVAGRRHIQPNVMPVHVRAENPFDFENPDHVDAVLKKIDNSRLTEKEVAKLPYYISRGDWEIIEDPAVQSAIKSLGHDAFFIKEDGVKNLGVYDPAQLKSATGNQGTFDQFDSDINKRDGGDVEGYIPHDDKRRVRNLKDFHGKTPKEIKEGKWFHGTNKDFSSFKSGESGAIFLTQSPSFAQDYTKQHMEHWHESFEPAKKEYDGIFSEPATKSYKPDVHAPNIMPVHVRAEKPFDYENKKHIAALYETLGPDLIMDPYLLKFMDEVREGYWGALESPPIQNAIKAMGHDSFFVSENGVKNLGVYDPSQIKSATGNQGTFDLSNPDITKADGGEIEYPLHDHEMTGGKLSNESPGEYLHRVNKADPVAINSDGGHRAEATKKANVKKTPVVTWPDKKKAGGPVVERALMIISKKV